ncbi:hypothetical protein [Pyrodictium abyssi]|uniref:Uncharacterized protein n=1 Tax=Pyrodictium abyssi TaxID=54256 RepID=A0ABN6ZM20_9CREN|nr:hypothetical protein PABY_08400 [Pyrodictium abyssi]
MRRFRVELPEGCMFEATGVVCNDPRAAESFVRSALWAAGLAGIDAELCSGRGRDVPEAALDPELAKRILEKVAHLEDENAKLRAELETWREVGSKVLSRIEEALRETELAEEAGELARELARLREALARALSSLAAAGEEIEKWRSAWLCYYVTPHEEPLAFKREYPDGLPRLARERHKELARRVKVLRERWYRELWGLPLVRLGKVYIAFSEAAARSFIRKYGEIFEPIVKQLRGLGYRTQAACECIPIRMLPEQAVEFLRKEIEETRRELALAEAKVLEHKAAARGSALQHQLDKIRRLRKRLQQLESLLRQLQRSQPSGARKLPVLAAARGEPRA